MRVTRTALPEVLLIDAQVFGDGRGFFYESFNARRLAQYVGDHIAFALESHARERQGVLRGLHYDLGQTQGRLARVTVGETWNVAVDLRPGSATFGHWVGATLSTDNRRQLWVPPGFAHGYVVLSRTAETLVKATRANIDDQRCLRWNDPTLAIAWPFEGQPILSAADAGSPTLEVASAA